MMNADQRQALLCLWLYNPKDNLTQSRKGRRGKSLKNFRDRGTEDTEKFKKQSGILCALCVSSERSERVVKRIINPSKSYWSEVDKQIKDPKYG